jgi:hypothetical protein
MKKEICRFSSVCKGYHAEHYSCAHESEACHFCGYYRLHKAAVLRVEMKDMLKNTEFGQLAE